MIPNHFGLWFLTKSIVHILDIKKLMISSLKRLRWFCLTKVLRPKMLYPFMCQKENIRKQMSQYNYKELCFSSFPTPLIILWPLFGDPSSRLLITGLNYQHWCIMINNKNIIYKNLSQSGATFKFFNFKSVYFFHHWKFQHTQFIKMSINRAQ